MEVRTRPAWARGKECWWPKWANPSPGPAILVLVTCANIRRRKGNGAYPDPRHGASREDAVFVANSDSGLAVVDGLLVSSHHDTFDPSIEAAHDIASAICFLKIAALHFVDAVFEGLQLLVELSLLDQSALERVSQTLVVGAPRLVSIGHARRRMVSHSGAKISKITR